MDTLDPETKQEIAKQKRIEDIVGHEAWPLLRQKLVDTIISVQQIAEYGETLDTCDANKLLVEMKANKRVAEILYAWISEIEGTAQQSKDNLSMFKKQGYVIRG